MRAIQFLALALFLVLTAVSPALAETGVFTEWQVPTQNSSLICLDVDAGGNLWFTEFNGDKVGRLDPLTNVVSEWRAPAGGLGPWCATLDAEGRLWFAETNPSRHLAMLDPATNTVKEWPVPLGYVLADAEVCGNYVWVSDVYGHRVARFEPATNTFTVWQVPTGSSGPLNLECDEDGNLWIGEFFANALARLDHNSGTYYTWGIPTSNSVSLFGPLTNIREGDIWFAEDVAGKIGKLDVATNTITEWSLPDVNSGPNEVEFDTSGNVWITEYKANVIASFDEAGQGVETVINPAKYNVSPVMDTIVNPTSTQVTPTDTYVEPVETTVEGVKIDGFTEWTVPTPSAALADMALTEDNEIVFMEGAGNKLGRLATVTTVEAEVDIKPGSFPNSINIKSRGVVPVAILSGEDFDATSVDALTVRFGPAEASAVHNDAHLEDVDGDGDTDVVLHFRTLETGIECSDTVADISGETNEGLAFTGSDSIVVRGCK